MASTDVHVMATFSINCDCKLHWANHWISDRKQKTGFEISQEEEGGAETK